MTLSYSKLKTPIFLYLSLPAFLFLAFFLRLSVAIPCVAAYGQTGHYQKQKKR